MVDFAIDEKGEMSGQQQHDQSYEAPAAAHGSRSLKRNRVSFCLKL